MARVVQQRTPPYLLIVFVILFVFATAMAVLFYTRYSGASTDLSKARRSLAELATDEQINRADIQQMMSRFQHPEGAVRETVVGQLTEQVSTLGSRITGLPNVTFSEAMQEIERTAKEIAPPPQKGLTKDMKGYFDEVQLKEAEIAKLKGERDQLSYQLGEARKAMEAAEADFKAKLAERDTQIAALDQKFTTFQTEHNTKLEEAKKEYNASKETLGKQVQELTDQIELLNRKLTVAQKTIEELKGTKVTKVDTEQVTRRADGKVRQVLGGQGLVYIDLGSKDRVTEGLRFTVYPYTGIPPSGLGKGVVEVTNVSENVSECRILQQSKSDPIVPGDLVANVVFDSLRNYAFVVEGQFDPDNTGTPTMAGNKSIKDLIRRYGGQVSSDVTFDTDYVVLGDPPARPRKPEDTDAQEMWDVYNDRLKAFNRYEDMKKAAEANQIPRLGAKRFLDMVGYIPAKPEHAE